MRFGVIYSVLALRLALVSCIRQNVFHKLKYEIHRNWKLLPVDECGIREGFDLEHVSQEGVAELGQYPWIVAIMIRINGSEEFQCGGSIINDRYVLTAAHCVHPKLDLKVRLGEHDQSTYVDCKRTAGRVRCAPARVVVEVDEVSAHPEYRYERDNFYERNDVALVRLKKPINKFNDFIRPICLPTFALYKDYNRRYLEVAGWGITSEGEFIDELHTLKVPVVPSQKCMSLWKEAIEERELCKTGKEEWCRMDIDDYELCAGGITGKGVIKGYSGGPLMATEPGPGREHLVFLVGVVSYGVEKIDFSRVAPDVYMRVSEYLPWILDTIHD